MPGNDGQPLGALPLSEALSVTLGVNNGWDAVTPNYSGKTFQGTIAWSGPSASTVAVTAYVGNNPTLWSGAANTTGETRTFLDGVLGTTVGALDLSVNFDYGTENSLAYWSGSAMAHVPEHPVAGGRPPPATPPIADGRIVVSPEPGTEYRHSAKRRHFVEP